LVQFTTAYYKKGGIMKKATLFLCFLLSFVLVQFCNAAPVAWGGWVQNSGQLQVYTGFPVFNGNPNNIVDVRAFMDYLLANFDQGSVTRSKEYARLFALLNKAEHNAASTSASDNDVSGVSVVASKGSATPRNWGGSVSNRSGTRKGSARTPDVKAGDLALDSEDSARTPDVKAGDLALDSEDSVSTSASDEDDSGVYAVASTDSASTPRNWGGLVTRKGSADNRWKVSTDGGQDDEDM
jgi:hypothetical protein